MTKLKWDDVKIPHSTVSSYTIYYTDDHQRPFSEWFTEDIDGPVNEAPLPNVHPDKPYYVKMFIHTDKRERLPTAVYKPRSPHFNRCEWARCEHFCKVLEDEFDTECSCRPGFRLNDDGRTCSPAITGLPPASKWPSPVADEICLDEPDVGTCQDRPEQFWYYNSTLEKCLPFVFGGCDGNENRFTDPNECMERCSVKPCLEQRRNTVHLAEDQRPKCDSDGDFEPVQVDHKKGQYYCVHPVTGEKILNTTTNTSDTGGPLYCKSK